MHGTIGEQLKAKYQMFARDQIRLGLQRALQDFNGDASATREFANRTMDEFFADVRADALKQNGVDHSSGVLRDLPMHVHPSQPLSADHAIRVQSDHYPFVRRDQNEQDQKLVVERPVPLCPAQPPNGLDQKSVADVCHKESVQTVTPKSNAEHQRFVDKVLANSTGPVVSDTKAIALRRPTSPTEEQKASARSVDAKLARKSLFDSLKLDSKPIRSIYYRELPAYIRDGYLAQAIIKEIGPGLSAWEKDKLIPELISEDRLRIMVAQDKRLALTHGVPR